MNIVYKQSIKTSGSLSDDLVHQRISPDMESLITVFLLWLGISWQSPAVLSDCLVLQDFFRALRWKHSTTNYLCHSNKSRLLIKTVLKNKTFSKYGASRLPPTTANMRQSSQSEPCGKTDFIHFFFTLLLHTLLVCLGFPRWIFLISKHDVVNVNERTAATMIILTKYYRFIIYTLFLFLQKQKEKDYNLDWLFCCVFAAS